MEISRAGRIIAAQIVKGAEGFSAGLGKSIDAVGSGSWAPGPLWEKPVLAMRTEAGYLKRGIANLEGLGKDVWAELPESLQSRYADELANAKFVLDEINEDKGGEFVERLEQFRRFGLELSTEVQAIVGTVVEGAQVLDFGLAGGVSAPAANAVQGAETALRALTAGSR